MNLNKLIIEDNLSPDLSGLNELFKEPKKQKPYDMGIKGFKRLLRDNTHLSRADKNKAVRAYKARIAERLMEVKKGLDNDGEV